MGKTIIYAIIFYISYIGNQHEIIRKHAKNRTHY